MYSFYNQYSHIFNKSSITNNFSLNDKVAYLEKVRTNSRILDFIQVEIEISKQERLIVSNSLCISIRNNIGF